MGAFEDLINRANGSSEPGKKKKTFEELVDQGSQMRMQEEVSKVDSDYINSFLDSSNSFFESAGKDYESAGWDNASLLYRKNQTVLDDLNHRREVIGKWMDANRGSLDDETYKHLTSVLTDFSRNTGSVMEALTGARDFYDRDKNQDAYLQYVDHQNKMGYDLGAGQKKIDDLTRAMELAKAMKKDSYSDPSANRHARREYQRILENYGLTGEDDLKELISAETVMFNQSKWTQQEAEMASVVDSPDFMQYSQMGAGMQNPSYEDATGGGYLFGWRPGADDVQNKVTFARDNAEALAKEKENRNGNSGIPAVVDPLYRHVTEEEAAIYSYYLAKDGAEKAEEYLQSLQDKLNQREAAEEYARIQGRTGLEVLYGATVGVDQFRSGMSSLFDDSDYIAPSAIQYAGQAARQDLEDNGPKILGSSLGQIGYDALSTTANMAPSILTSMAVGMVSKTAGAAVGNALMGASAAGNAYAQKLNDGYSKEQARTYGLMVGASEIAMEKLLGGITALGGGTLSKMAIKGLDKVDNVLARVAKSAGGKILMNAGSEALEEGLQSILEPYIWQAVSGEDANVDWEEALYSSLLGFVTGGVFEGGNTIAESSVQRANRNAEALELYGPEQEALVTEGLELDPDSKFAQRMQGRLDRGKDLTGGQLYKLGQHNEAAMVKNDISTIQQAAETALTNYGETGDVKVISEALAKQAAGKKLSKAERTVISESKYGQRVANELNPENIQSGDFNTAWAESIGTERINAEEYGRLVKDAEASPVSAESTTDAPEGSATANLTGVDSTISEEVFDSTTEADTSVRLEEASQKYGAQAKAMVATFNPGQNVASFDRAYGVAYEMGKSGVSMDYAVNSRATGYLTQAQRELAYRQGAFAATNKTKTTDALYKGMGSTEGGRRKGAVKLEGIKASEFRKMLKDSNDPRGKAAKALMTIAEVTGIDIVLFKSQVDASGKYVGEQGRFEWKDDTIYIDVNAGLSYGSDAGELTKYAMLRTFGHEFTHFLEKNAATQYSEFRKLVFAEMTKAGTNVDYLIQRKQAQYKEQGLSYEAASREVVAESMGDILRDSNFVETLAQKHNSLFKTLLDQFKRFIRNIRSYFNSLAANTSPEAKALKEEINGTLKYMDSIVEAFDKMAVEAVENYQARMAESDGIVAELTPGQEGVVVGKDGEPVAYSTEDGTVMLSIRTYEEEGRSAFRAYLEKCVTSKKLTKTEMTEMLDGIEEIYTVCKEFKYKYAPFSAWSDAEVIRDTKGKPVFSVVTPNGEYKMNLDFSLVCKKRRALDAVLNEMSKRGIIDDFELGKKTIVKINELIRKHGFETACALCFVDAKRFRQADVADSMVKLYNDLVKSLVPEGSVDQIEHFNFAGVRTKTSVENGIHTWANSELDFTHINEVLEQYGKDTVEAKAAKYIKNNPKGRRLLQRGDFMSSGGFDAVKSQNQDIMSLYNSKKGTGGPKAAFGDVQYLNEVISKARWWTPKKAYEVGGVRVQSFSDYVPRMVFDYVQMIYDLAATKLPAHAYTKEALFVKQFGKTGIKINMSLIPAVVEDGIAPGLDANGDYVWAGESFDYDTAVEIQSKPGYTENCGTICVGVSYEHILKLLRDPNIRMVIPYHKSGLNPVVAHMNKVDKFVDYTSLKSNPGGCQNTMDAEGKKVEKDFNFNEALRKSGDPRAAADAYLKWCDEHGYTPKFAEFRGEENYYKLLIDFTVYDESGAYVPQREVRAVFPKKGDAFGSMKDLIASGLEEDAVVQGARDMKISEIVDEIQRSIPRSEAEISDDEQVEQADRDLEADLMDESRVQHQARDYSKATKNTTNEGGVPKNMKKISINRYIIPYKDKAEQWAVIDRKAVDLESRGKVINLTSENVLKHKDAVQWKDKKAVREFLRSVLASDQGVSVYFEYDGQLAIAYLTSHGIKHAVGGYASPRKAAAFEAFRELVKNAEYTFSSLHDEHSEIGKNMPGETIWDFFVSVAMIDGKSYPVAFKLRTTDSDVRSQIYEMYQTKEDGVFHGAGKQESADGHPIYESIPSSGGTITQENGDVKDDVQNQLRTNTPTDHEILDMAAKELDTSKLTDGERAALDIFRKKVTALKALKEERQKQGSLYHEAQFGENRDKAKASAARNRMSVLDKQITRASAEVLSLEDKKVLKDVLQKSRKVIEQHERKASLNAIRAAREETRARERKKADERIEALRQKKNERIAEVRSEERQKAQDKVENRKKTELRAKIQKQLSELNSLLQNGNKKKNVKNGMKDTASALLAYGELLFSDDANISPETMVRNGIGTDITDKESQLLNEFTDLLEKRDRYLGQISEAASSTDENKDARIEGLQKMVDLINKKKLPELTKKLDSVFERERARLNKVTFSTVLKDLTDSYKALEQSKDPFVSGAYNSYVYDRLVAMNNPNSGVGVGVRDMSLAQLAELNDAIKMVVTSIKNANALFRDGQREVLSERAEKVFMEIRKLYRKGGDPTVVKNAVTDTIKSFAWNELKPIYAFERIGSEKFTELFWDVINGESEYGLECENAAGFVGEIRDTYGYKKWDFDKVKVFKTVDGQDFKLTLGDMMSIYAYSRRDQAHKHMFEGGFTFHTGKTETYKDTDGKKRVRLVEEDTYRMTPELLDKILSSLSKEQKAYAEAMQDYLTKLGDMGNKVSRILYGIDLFKETHYFPLKSDRDYRSTVETQLNQTQTAASLVNIGMAKETVPEASNPIVLQRFDDVAVQHIDQMLKYSSMVLPIENLRKVMDFAPGEYGTWNTPVKKLISTVHGASASQYVSQWLTDLNGSSGVDGAKNPLSSMFARSKKVAVAGNLSVVAQQYFAVARAMSEIDGKYFFSSDGKADGSQWEELKRWAGVAVIKDIGGFDMGSARSATEYIGKTGAKTSIGDKIDKAASYGSAKMDELGWGTIWKAAKAEIADTTDLKIGSDEFFKAAAKRFTEVVVKTQVYDSVTARSGFMRSKRDSVKYLVSFMGEPTTTVNMMLNAQMKLIRAKRSGNKADLKKARAYMARTSGAVILSTVLGIIAKSAVYAMRDDEETESFMERYMKQVGSSFHQELNPLNLLPVARDIMSMIQGRDIERPDMALINSTIKAFRKALKADENQVEAWIDVVLSFGNLLGVPLRNVLRDGAGVARLIGDTTDDISPKELGKTFFREGFLGKESTKNENLYAAIVSEDTGRLEVLKKGYKTDSDYTNAVRKALRECDDRIHAAAHARYEGDTMTYMEIAKEIISEGHFVQDDVVAAIMTEVTAMENEAAEKKESNPKTYSMYNAADYLSVVDQPKASKEIKDYLIAGYIEKGKTEAEAEAEFKSDVKDQVKSWYTDEESEVRISKQQATEMLRKYVGMNADDVTSTINQWSCKVVTGIAYEDIKDEFLAGNITASRAIDMRVRYGGESREDATVEVTAWEAVKKYGLSLEDAEGYTKRIEELGQSLEQAGIRHDIYLRYKDLKSECKGVDANGDGKPDSGTKKAEIMEAIHSLPISVAQKDALYYSNGWSKNTIHEAPWH